jgi:hypothetical protein
MAAASWLDRYSVDAATRNKKLIRQAPQILHMPHKPSPGLGIGFPAAFNPCIAKSIVVLGMKFISSLSGSLSSHQSRGAIRIIGF